MKKLLSLLLILVLLPLTAFAAESEPSGVHAFDFELTGELLWENFPEEVREQIKGYADLLAITKITGTAAFAEDGNHSFDVDLKITVKDTKEAVVPVHFFGYDDLIFFDSPLINNEIFYMDLHGLMIIATKMVDYFDFPFNDLILAIPGYWDVGTKGLRATFADLLSTVDSNGLIAEENVQHWAEKMSALHDTDQPFEFWLKGIGLQSDFNSEMEEDLEHMPEYMKGITLGNGIRFIGNDSQTVLEAGEQVLFSENRNEGGSGSLSFELPKTPVYENVFHGAVDYTVKDQTLDFKAELTIAPEKGGKVLDVKVDAMELPTCFPFEKNFEVQIDMEGTLKGAGKTRVIGSRENQLCKIRVEHDFNKQSGLQHVLDLNIRFQPIEWNQTMDVYNKYVKNSYAYYVLSQNETTLAELEGRIAGPMIKGLLPVLVQAPASFCKSIMDFVCDHNIIAFVTGHFNAEDMD